jgi:hypothetical protein
MMANDISFKILLLLFFKVPIKSTTNAWLGWSNKDINADWNEV